jgi:ATP-binding cassette subfamily B protein
MPRKFPHYRQLDTMDCGPTCVRMIADHFGRKYSLQKLRELSHSDREGVSAFSISECAEAIGLETVAVKIGFEEEGDDPDFFDLPTPFVAHWNHRHFLVVHKVDKKYIHVADPAYGLDKFSHKKFRKNWATDGDKGIAIMMEAGPEFFEHPEEKIEKTGFSFLFKFMTPYKKLLIQLFLGVIIGVLISLVFPFLTQAIVDVGIQNNDLNFIFLILLGQLVLFISQVIVQFIQNWILLHIGARINVRLLYNFLTKLMRLPIGFFDTKMTGDLVQRVLDHRRIELFLTTSTLGIVFSIANFLIFGIILYIYNPLIFGIFFVFSVLYMIWIIAFLNKRKNVDHLLFKERAENHQTLIELIHGMQEVKLQNSEYKRKWYWVHIQARLFRANIKSLSVTQWQDAGANFFSQIKDIFIIFIAAKAVLEGAMTLGMMLAIQYIIGQLNAPLKQMIQFVRTWQDAKISLERLGEIHTMKEEEAPEGNQISVLPANTDFHIEAVNFKYNEHSDLVLKNINLTIPKGKITAIVGTSGSGKTTLVKLLLGFYHPTSGRIKVGNSLLKNISSRFWRSQCGAVMQDGFIFSDSIANNVAESEDVVDKAKLLKAVQIANIQTFIERMPLGYNTKIGKTGNGLSRGQEQRLLIARAVYKDPKFLFFDEATNALDANNEKTIVENLNQFFKGRTVVVVAHRLSTVKDADQIVVLEKGELIERGTHEELTALRGAYYKLVKNQLELGT